MRWRQVQAGELVPESWNQGGWARPLCDGVMQSGFRWACATDGTTSFADLQEMQRHVAAGPEVHQIVVMCPAHGPEGPRP